VVPPGQPLAAAHCSTCKCPPRAANAQVIEFHGQPFARAHCRTARWPLRAAAEQVRTFQGQPLARAHCSSFKCPLAAASRQKTLERLRSGITLASNLQVLLQGTSEYDSMYTVLKSKRSKSPGSDSRPVKAPKPSQTPARRQTRSKGVREEKADKGQTSSARARVPYHCIRLTPCTS
jgi:hypothetical protein